MHLPLSANRGSRATPVLSTRSSFVQYGCAHVKGDTEFMMNDPIVVWPPGTFWGDCGQIGAYFDCSDLFPGFDGTICCWGW
jgi:hypothetical protein